MIAAAAAAAATVFQKLRKGAVDVPGNDKLEADNGGGRGLSLSPSAGEGYSCGEGRFTLLQRGAGHGESRMGEKEHPQSSMHFFFMDQKM